MNGTILNRVVPIYTPSPVNKAHPLSRGRVGWWMALPPRTGGLFLYDLMGLYHSTLTSMGNANNGWRSTERPGGFADLLFDGSAGYVSAPLPAGLSNLSYTVAAWIFPTNLTGRFTVLTDSAGAAGIGCEVGNGNALTNGILLNSGGFWAQSANNAIVLNAWQHVAWVVSSGATTDRHLYVNGLDVTNTTANAITSASLSGVNIGRRAVTNSQYFPGHIDDIGIWNRPLSAAEVKAYYDLSRNGYPGVLNRVGMSWAGAVLVGGTTFNQAITATVTDTPSMLRSTGKNLGVTITNTATMARSVGKILSAASAATASCIKSAGKIMSATCASTASIARSTGKNLSASVTSTPSAVKQTAHALLVTVSASAALAAGRAVLKTLSASVTTTASMTRQAGKVMAATITTAASYRRSIGKTLLAIPSATPTIARGIAKGLSTTVTTLGTIAAAVAGQVRLILASARALLDGITRRGRGDDNIRRGGGKA